MNENLTDHRRKSSLRSQVVVAVFTGMLMIIAVVAMAFANVEKRKYIEDINKSEAPGLNNALIREFQITREELAYLREANLEMESLLEAQREELDARQVRIGELLNEQHRNRQLKKELEALRAELDSYRSGLAAVEMWDYSTKGKVNFQP